MGGQSRKGAGCLLTFERETVAQARGADRIEGLWCGICEQQQRQQCEGLCAEAAFVGRAER
jgi:hypothetical protein